MSHRPFPEHRAPTKGASRDRRVCGKTLTVLVLGISCASCLQRNELFSLQKRMGDPPLDGKGQDVEISIPESTGSQSSAPPDSNSSLASTAQPELSTGGGQSPSSADESASQGSSTSASAQAPIARHAIEIVNNSSERSLSTGYSISLEFDHAAFVRAGYRADGSDMAVISKVGDVDLSLPRTLDPKSSWGQANTKLWFSLPSPIGAAQSNSNQYFLLFADTRFPGLDRPKEVFLDYDSFDGDALDTRAWHVHASSDFGSSGQDVANGRLRLWSIGQGSGSYRQIHSNSSWQTPGVRIEAEIAARGGSTSGRGGCSRERILAAWSQIDNRVRTAIAQTQRSLYFEAMQEPFGNQLQTLQNSTVDEISHRFAIDWLGNNIGLFRDQVFLDRVRGLGNFTSPDSTPMIYGVGTSAFGDTCAGVISEVLVDWILVRQLVVPEPAARVLGP